MFVTAVVTFLLTQYPVPKGMEPIKIAGVIKPGRCRVPLVLAGQRELFLVDTGIEKSYIRADAKAKILKVDPDATVSFGSGSVRVSSLPTQSSTVYQEIPPIAGIIGMDVLSKGVFSIDFDKQEFLVWPEGASGKDLGSGFFRKDDEIASVALMRDTGYLAPFIETSLGQAVIDTGAAVSLLGRGSASSKDVLATSLSRPMEFFETSAGKATRVVVRSMSIGGRDLFCQPMLLSDTTDVAVISASLLGRRVLFDFPNKRVEYAVSSETQLACAAFSSLLHGVVEVKDGELYLRAQTAKNLGATKSPLVKVLSIDGRKGSEWLTMFRNREQRTAEALRDAFDSLSRSGKVVVLHNGRAENLLIAPFLSP